MASIAAGVLRRMVVDRSEQSFPLIFYLQINCFVVDRSTVGRCNTPLAIAPYLRHKYFPLPFKLNTQYIANFVRAFRHPS
ncbi:hypothetical protein [Undibacterium sp.]|uniref:hypothetical protein n=1 Tax=Undibacterium sp. TaxID=1914977 RepID=UPI0037520009